MTDRSEQWKSGGQCSICRRKCFCNKQCKANKEKFNRELLSEIERKLWKIWN